MSMKTLEFKLNLTPEQKEARDSWVSGLRWVWNTGLEFLENFYRFHAWDSLSQTWVPCSPIPWQYRKQGEHQIPYCWIGKAYACPIPQPYRPLPLVGNPGSNPYYWLRPYFTQKNHPDKLWFKNIPSIFVINTLERLATSWNQYRKGTKGKPRYRSRKTQSTTLATTQAKAKVSVRGRYIRIPGLGKLLVKGLDTRLPKGVQPATLSICKFASGDYLQLGVELPDVPLPDSDLACGVDVGIEYLYATDHGRLVEPPNYFKQSEQRLARLQRKLSHRKGRKFPKQEGSKNYQKFQNKIARLHEKVARQRRAFNHWHSSNLVRMSGAIAVEKIDFNELISSPEPIPKADQSGYEHNNAIVQRRYNKALTDAGCGQFLAFLEQKSQEPNREFQRVKSAYTSQDCPRCGHRNQLDLNQRMFCCEQCGYQSQRKHAAANVIRQSAVFARSYRGCHRDVMPVESPLVEAMKQESQPVRVGTVPTDEQVDINLATIVNASANAQNSLSAR